MSDSELNDELYELLSGFVDGELTGQELAEAEALVRENPRAAAFVDELRSMASCLRGLPRERPQRDLHGAILTAIRDEAPARADERAIFSVAQRDHRVRRRALMWAGLSVAAVLLLMFMPWELGHKDDTTVARNGQTKSVHDESNVSESAESGPAVSSGRSLRSAGRTPAQKVPAREPAAARELLAAEDGVRGDGAQEDAALEGEVTGLGYGSQIASPPAAAPMPTGRPEAKEQIAPGAAREERATGATPSLAGGAEGSAEEVAESSVPTSSELSLGRSPASPPVEQQKVADTTGALGGGAATRGGAPQSGGVTRIIEIPINEPEEIQDFESLLAINAIRLNPGAVPAEKVFGEDRQTEQAMEDDSSAAAILVEAAPEQIDQIVADWQTEAAKLFARRRAIDQIEPGRSGDFRATSSEREEADSKFRSGAIVRASETKPDDEPAGQVRRQFAPGASGWRLYVDRDESKPRESAKTVADDIAAPAGASAAAPMSSQSGETPSRVSGRYYGFESLSATPSADKKAEPAADSIRVLFLLRAPRAETPPRTGPAQ